MCWCVLWLLLYKDRLTNLVGIYRILEEIHPLVSMRNDTVTNPSLDYCVVYVDQFRVGLHFPLIPLLVEVLGYYRIALSQLVHNAIMVIVSFER